MGKRNLLAVLPAVLTGVVVYLALMFRMGALRPSDVRRFPGGARLERLFRLVQLIREDM